MIRNTLQINHSITQTKHIYIAPYDDDDDDDDERMNFNAAYRGVAARIFGLGGRPCRVEPDKHRPFNQCLTFLWAF